MSRLSHTHYDTFMWYWLYHVSVICTVCSNCERGDLTEYKFVFPRPVNAWFANTVTRVFGTTHLQMCFPRVRWRLLLGLTYATTSTTREVLPAPGNTLGPA